MDVIALLALLFIHGVCGCDTGCVFQPVSNYSSYNGTVSKSINGKTCCNWTQSNQMAGIVAGTNYCRAKDDRNAFCYVGNCAAPTLEYCDVGTYACPICADPVVTPTPSVPLTYPCIAPQALASTNTSIAPRVVGGADAIPHEFPFYVSIQRDAYVYCGGSLIHKDWVLTAAHCTFEYDGSATPANAYTIKIGVHKWDDTDSCVETRTVVNIIRLQGYDSQTGANDLAFFKLSASSNYPPITMNYEGLTTEDLEAEGLMATVIGHGSRREGDYAAPTLQKALVPIFNQANCQSYWSNAVNHMEICAAYQQGTVDTCAGDSGGPIFVKRGTTFIQIGTTAFGNGCALPNIPAVYMRLSAYRDWICSLSLPAEICEGAATAAPTARPTLAPATRVPTSRPTPRPTTPTRLPTRQPSTAPTRLPTTRTPTRTPSTRVPSTTAPSTQRPSTPSRAPTLAPSTRAPSTRTPTLAPSTRAPSTRTPTLAPSTRVPTTPSTQRPTSPTRSPTRRPSSATPSLPTSAPSTLLPTASPTPSPTTREPTDTRAPTLSPTQTPTQTPTALPTHSPTQPTAPTRTPTYRVIYNMPTEAPPDLSVASTTTTQLLLLLFSLALCL